MQFAWTFVAFAGLKRGKLTDSRRTPYPAEDQDVPETFNLLNDEKSSVGSLTVEEEEKIDFVPPNGTIDFSIKQVYKMDSDKLSDTQICDQIVEVCRHPQKYRQKTINCDFSISLQSATSENFNIKSDDLRKLKGTD
jgi:hypothetical protein